MTAKEIYDQLGESYDEVLGRLAKDERIVKYLNKFIEQDTCTEMLKALEANDYQEAFRMIHSLKGMSLNMGFSSYLIDCEVLCESLRNGMPDHNIDAEVKKVQDGYEKIKSTIIQLNA